MDIYRSFSDAELAERLDRKDNAALEQVYLRYWAGLFNFSSRLLRDEAAAEDLVHDLFVYLLNNMGKLNIKTPLDAYLYKAIKNRVIDLYRVDTNKKKYVESLKHFIEQGQFATDEAVLEREMKKRIEEAVATFPPKMREVYEMSRNQYFSRSEIAEATGTSPKTVDTQLNRALNLLRTRLSGWFF
jgi:RNA polymerase sigma-70 factor (ECF subfamily)